MGIDLGIEDGAVLVNAIFQVLLSCVAMIFMRGCTLYTNHILTFHSYCSNVSLSHDVGYYVSHCGLEFTVLNVANFLKEYCSLFFATVLLQP